MNFLSYLLAALALWMHPTNSIQLSDAQRIPVVCGANPYTAYTLSSLLVAEQATIYVNCDRWKDWSEWTREWVIAHEVGHIFGLWDTHQNINHGGDGMMNCGYEDTASCAGITASDRFQMSKMMPSPVVRRAIVPMVAH